MEQPVVRRLLALPAAWQDRQAFRSNAGNLTFADLEDLSRGAAENAEYILCAASPRLRVIPRFFGGTPNVLSISAPERYSP